MTHSTECAIRTALESDADAISAIILRALRETNARDYSAEIIDRIVRGFAPSAVRQQIATRTVVVATISGRIVGTASLDGNVVRAVFVAPDSQGRGVGVALMDEIARLARAGGVEALTLQSSITAEAFYARLGFVVVSQDCRDGERIIVMQRRLEEAS